MDILAEFDARIRQGYSVSDALDELMEISAGDAADFAQPIKVYTVPHSTVSSATAARIKAFYDPPSKEPMSAHKHSPVRGGFGPSFRAARAAGQSSFTYGGKQYHTRMAPSPPSKPGR